MRFGLALLAALVAVVIANPVQDSGSGHHKFDVKIEDKEHLEKQKHVLHLFWHINQPSHYKEHLDIIEKFDIEHVSSYFTKPEVHEHFLEVYHEGLLHRGDIFSVFYDEHLHEAIALFKLFYYAKDFDHFYKVAVWARNHVNEGVYLYALSVAVIHRKDTYGIVLPPIYEVYPHYFFSNEVINKAQFYKQIREASNHVYTVNSNYSGHYLNLHPEQSLSYFTEDIGMNSVYYYYSLYYPHWMCGEEFGLEHDHRGELFYFVHQQLLARYYLERVSNGNGEIPVLDIDVPFEYSYHPSLQYPNGLEFPTRPKFANLHEYFYNYGMKQYPPYSYSYDFVKTYYRRINDAIDRGVVYDAKGEKVDLNSEEGFNILGNLIESNHDSVNTRFYGNLIKYYRHILGYSTLPLNSHHVVPSALEHHETSLRDPAFYILYKKIVNKFQRYLHNHGHYDHDDLVFKGVHVTNVEFDRLITFFDHFYADIDNAVYYSEKELEDDSFHVRVKQHRLNFKPFTYKVHVKAEAPVKASVKIFIGPKYDEYGRYINFSDNRLNFVEFDHFVYDLKAGDNVIEKNSHEMTYYTPDRTSYRELYKRVVGATKGQNDFVIDGRENYFLMPQRFMLPKGDYSGVPYQFFIYVYPYVAYEGRVEKEQPKFMYPRPGVGGPYLDNYPVGYPLNKYIEHEKMYHELPNAYFYETKVYHRSEEDVNASNVQH